MRSSPAVQDCHKNLPRRYKVSSQLTLSRCIQAIDVSSLLQLTLSERAGAFSFTPNIKEQLKIWKGLECSLEKIPREPESGILSLPSQNLFYVYRKPFALCWTWLVSGLSATWCRCLHRLPCQHSPSHYSQNLISLSERPCVKEPFGTTWLFPSACCVSPDGWSGERQALTTVLEPVHLEERSTITWCSSPFH